ncbi:single-stranded DNA-binding protein [Arthrobacter sp. efr-133-TYG-118]|uniref:single-stranded DNA-binding protein n=1 Tax=Arthrobacter sp. efr-133-TYG-118 TaxID=3040279 RepID=UPI00254A54CE|nr:single-stranded DNA-binding protein [Arthrobacter sp. efr-133-TYG-118]
MTNILTITGNLTADPELRRTPSGSPVTNFTIADTPRTKNPQTNEWVDGETLFMRCAVWREAAENVAASLTKGMRVTATGKLKARSYETKEGEKRTAIELEIEEIGPALKYATAKVTRTQGDGQQAQRNGGAPQQSGSWGGQPQQSSGWGSTPSAAEPGWGEPNF